jgi:hypothetical protein
MGFLLLVQFYTMQNDNSLENKRKHLEFIQNVITRMNSNSFLIKGWAVTLVSALFALAAKDSNRMFVVISIIPTTAFWVLDGFFISCERKFRGLYKEVTDIGEDKDITFSMDVSGQTGADKSWLSGIFSKTLLAFYALIMVGTCAIWYLLMWYSLL